MTVIATILLAIHLVAMNIASAAPLICIWLEVRGRRGNEAAWRAGRELARWSAVGLLLGVATGAALGVVAWFDPAREFAEAIGRFPTSAFVYASGEIVFSLACLGIYAGMWERWRERPGLHALFAVLAATNLLYHFPPLMAVISELAVRPEMVSEPVISRAVFRPLMLRPEVLSQSAHFAVASVAVAGAGLVLVAWRLKRAQEAGADRLISAGAWIALLASLLQLAIGVWVVFELPPNVRGGLMGNAWPATGLFVAAMVITLGLLHSLATTALGDTSDANVRRCILLMLAVVVLMTTMLREVRSDQGVGGASRAGLPQATTGS
jgi:cytochrome bd-type quinol oxidase subunit 2